MPLALLLLSYVAVGLFVAYVGEEELRSSARGPWQTLCARALAAHVALLSLPLVAYWLWRAPDWAVSYVAHASRAPSLALALLALAAGLAPLAGFALGARAITAHRVSWLPSAAAALVLVALVGVLVARRRFGVMTSYVHFHGGLGPTPGERAIAPWSALAALGPWVFAVLALVLTLRRRTPALTLRNRG